MVDLLDRRLFSGGSLLADPDGLVTILNNIITTVNNSNNEELTIDMLDAADVPGGGTTQTVGFQIRDGDGDPIAREILMQFAVFDDANVSIPAANATLNSPGAGMTIAHGAGSAALVVKTDAAGLFTCTLTNPFSTTVYLACAPNFATPPYRGIDSVAFTP